VGGGFVGGDPRAGTRQNPIAGWKKQLVISIGRTPLPEERDRVHLREEESNGIAIVQGHSEEIIGSLFGRDGRERTARSYSEDLSHAFRGENRDLSGRASELPSQALQRVLGDDLPAPEGIQR
jgi:hypothetical protein